jgi:hypothetical protein
VIAANQPENNETTASAAVTRADGCQNATGESGAHAEGAGLDSIRYLEAKLILKPEPFTSSKVFRDFGKIVRHTAEKAGVGFEKDEGFDNPPEIREVVFFDTPDFHFYRNAFILRRRISYVEGFPLGDPEIVFKFRHPDESRAAALDMRPQSGDKYRIKFKAEVLPLKDQIGGFRLLYSHNCQFGLSHANQFNNVSTSNVLDLFPSAKTLRRGDESYVLPVNAGIVEEVLLPIGLLDFGKGITGKCGIALWRTRGEHKSLVGEFAFQTKVDPEESHVKEHLANSASFYIALQHALSDWIALGVTKTAMVYRLNGTEPLSHE